MLMDTLVVNLFGAPCAGKSTGAAYIFALLKMAGINAELVTEVVKDELWEDNETALKNQAYILGRQSYKLTRLLGKVDVIITDSPLLLSIEYNSQSELSEHFDPYVLDLFNSFNNRNYFLHRTEDYNPVGRFETEEESERVSENLLTLLNKNGISYTEIDATTSNYINIALEISDMIKHKGDDKNA